MAQAYGKTHGWAYNSNKWHMNIIWSTGAVNISNMFKMLKVFHQNMIIKIPLFFMGNLTEKILIVFF